MIEVQKDCVKQVVLRGKVAKNRTLCDSRTFGDEFGWRSKSMGGNYGRC